ncbi:signal peptidase I [Flavobacterium proteolyticum]|uniref:Signal peptidase I n=1 Tax=Flavobacterium proteolyticum TaxID=2911683 RepID=A0ABR9WMI9_9FLAO|nr:signal peptidase I [Flavobacterium proteolyticum]MBE9575127.1 signal peptidase I [Flavobacterium proteolyticum]
MEISGWLVFILLVQVIHGIGTWKLYVKAGRKAWEAFVPVYNGIVLMQIINRPKWWILLLFIPVINLFLFPIIWIETLRTFGKKSTVDMVLGVVTLGFYIAYVNYTQETTYHADRDLKAPNKTMDTLGSLSFAVVVATLVHTYFIQPYTIPTSSLEKSLLIGDFLFVSKFHYGARTPMTPIAAPMVHDTLPIIKTKSYLAKPSLPYFRFPALQKIERNDIVVFNWPADTLFHMYKAADKRYDKPIDKKTNYVKRCTAIPGDKIEIRDGIIFINGKESILPERAKPQYSYKVAWDGKTPVDLDYIKKELNITDAFGQIAKDTLIFSALPRASVDRLKNIPGLTKVERIIHKETDKSIFPGTKDWNVDNLGPIYIPEAGKSVELNKETLPFYKKVIGEYEGNDLKVNGDEIRINGQVATSYTFKQDYYWMMGDNRHNSLDSRYWGFVPADHIVGKPIFIWMSIDGINDGIRNWSIRWDRLFTTVSGDGQPKSYFQYFLIALAAYFAFDYFRKKKKKKEEA